MSKFRFLSRCDDFVDLFNCELIASMVKTVKSQYKDFPTLRIILEFPVPNRS